MKGIVKDEHNKYLSFLILILLFSLCIHIKCFIDHGTMSSMAKLCSSFYVFFFMFSMFRYDYTPDNFYIRIILGFSALGLMYIFAGQYIRIYRDIYGYENIYYKLILIMRFECPLVVIASILLRKVKINYPLETFVALSFSFFITPHVYVMFIKTTVNVVGKSLVTIVFGLIILALLAMIYVVNKYRKELSKSCYENLTLYGAFNIMTFAICYICYELKNMYLYTLIFNCSSLLVIFIFRLLVVDIINKPRETMFRELSSKNEQLEKEVHDRYVRNLILKQFVDLISEGIVAYVDGKIEYINEPVMKMLGLDSDKGIIGHEKSEFVTKKDYEKYLEDKANFPDGGFTNDATITHNGRVVDAEITTFYTLFDNRRMELSIIKDKHIYNELMKKSQELKKKEEENELKNELLMNISHEFKTPINVIYSGVQMQTQCIKDNNFDNIDYYNKCIINNCHRLIKLINNFIDSVKYEGGSFNEPLSCMNIVPITEAVTLSIKPYALEKEIEVEFDTTDEDIYCDINLDLFDRAMLNLLSNAIKYNSLGGKISVVLKANDNNVEIAVKDTGAGIPKDKIDQLFERFERLDRTTTRFQEGSGLGLNIVKNVVKYMHGSIRVDSEEGKGSSFIITLPTIDNSVAMEIAVDEDEKITTPLSSKVKVELSDIY